MIYLEKGDVPAFLADNAETWTKELLEAVESDSATEALWNKYRNAQIKEALEQESHQKCAYCESKMKHVSFGDIEHIKPKSKFPEATYDWRNLALVRPKCNNSKRDKYDVTTPPVNPYEDDPSAFLMALGPMLCPKIGSDRGEVTITLLNLNRAELIERRTQRIEDLRRLVERISSATSVGLKHVLEDQLSQEIAADREYSFIAASAVDKLQS